jgi:NtrC-family two-component system sensor histidine kinase KinB
LLLSHVALVVLMAAVSLSAILSLRGIRQTFNPGRIGNSRAASGAEFLNNALMEQRTMMWLLLSGSIQEAKQANDDSWRQFERGLEFVHSPGVEDSVAELGDEIEDEAQIYKKLSDHLLAVNELTIQPSAETTVRRILEPRLNDMREQATRMETEATAASDQDSIQARQASDATLRRSALVTVIGIFIALYLGNRMVRAAVFPLKELATRAERISQGDLSADPQMHRQDEIGALSKALERMTDSIREARHMALRRLQRAEQMSDAALEHLYDPVVVLDPKGRIVHLNQAAEDLLGKIQEGEKVPIAEHIKDKRLARALTKAAGSQEISASEDEANSIVLPFKGETKVFRLRATPMKDDDDAALGSVAVLEDVTHFREIDRLKNEFIGVASHELRTPVSSLLLSAQLLKDGAVGELTADQQEIVELQLQDLARLEKLMRDLLDVTKLAAGFSPLHLERVQVQDLIEGTVSAMQSVAAKNGVELISVNSPNLGAVCVDRSQIGRVLTNLTANAIRHTGGKGRNNPHVKLGAHASNNEVTFYVEDSGEGIPAEYRARVFDRFVQVPGATQGGAGLGLSIAQNIVKAHHGSMGVESEVGKGSVFHFTLPIDCDVLGREKSA